MMAPNQIKYCANQSEVSVISIQGPRSKPIKRVRLRQGASQANTGIELEHASEVIDDEEDEVADEENNYESNSQNENMGK